MAGVFLSLVFLAIHWLIVLPVALIIATPYILVASMFSSLPYWRAILNAYKGLYRSFAKFWEQIGWGFGP